MTNTKRGAARSGRATAVALVTLLICVFALPRVAGALGLSSSSNVCQPVGGNSSVGGDSTVGGQSPPAECCTDGTVGGDSSVGDDSTVGGQSPPVECGATTLSISLTVDSDSDGEHGEHGERHHHHHTSVTAHAVLAGENSASASGTVTYTVSSGDEVVDTDTEPVVNGIVADSETVSLEAGTYSWQASYSGDSHNAPSQSPVLVETISGHCDCHDEH